MIVIEVSHIIFIYTLTFVLWLYKLILGFSHHQHTYNFSPHFSLYSIDKKKIIIAKWLVNIYVSCNHNDRWGTHSYGNQGCNQDPQPQNNQEPGHGEQDQARDHQSQAFPSPSHYKAVSFIDIL